MSKTLILIGIINVFSAVFLWGLTSVFIFESPCARTCTIPRFSDILLSQICILLSFTLLISGSFLLYSGLEE